MTQQVENFTCTVCGKERPRSSMHTRVVAGWLAVPGGKANVWCSTCQGDANRNSRERLQRLIAELKQGADPRRERELALELRKAGHPDVDGLLRAVGERLKRDGADKGRGAW